MDAGAEKLSLSWVLGATGLYNSASGSKLQQLNEG